MNIDQEIRDKVREAQHHLNEKAARVVGNIIEHRPQDPNTFKRKLPTTRPPQKNQSNSSPTVVVSEQTTNPDRPIPSDQNEKVESKLPFTRDDVMRYNWLNMDKVELDKLAWMFDQQDQGTDTVKTEHNQARFDLEGRVIPPTGTTAATDINSHLGLHHHGEDPDQPGYTIQELICYLQSTHAPQKVLAMNVLGNICVWSHMSVYDNVFDVNVVKLIIDDALLSVRVALDSRNESVAVHAIRCLHSIICNTIVDETLMDSVFTIFTTSPTKNLWLDPMIGKEAEFSAETIFEADLSDADCVKRDAIGALVERTDLLTRLRYFISSKPSMTLRNDPNVHDCILDILIRVARHSPRMCVILADYPYLMQCVVETFLPVAITIEVLSKKKPAVKAIKLIRIIASADIKSSELGLSRKSFNSDQVFTSFLDAHMGQIYPALLSYIMIEPPHHRDFISQHCLLVSVETLRCWVVLLQLQSSRKAMGEYFSSVFETIMERLRSISKLDPTSERSMKSSLSYDWQYAAALIKAIEQFSQVQPTVAENLICQVTNIGLAWFTAVRTQNIIPSIEVSVAIEAAISCMLRTRRLDKINSVYLILKSMAADFDLNSCLFKRITKHCVNQSPLVVHHAHRGCLRDAKNLPSYGCVAYDLSKSRKEFILNPYLSDESSFIMFKIIIDCLTQTPGDRLEYMKYFVTDNALHRYLAGLILFHADHQTSDELAKFEEKAVHINIFEQIELISMARCVLYICEYYLESSIESREKEFTIDRMNFNRLNQKILDESRLQCYDCLLSIVLVCVSLLSGRSDESESLRAKLMEQVLLNGKIHELVHQEGYLRIHKRDRSKAREYFPEIDSPFEFISSGAFLNLSSVYKDKKRTFSSKLWLFTPLLDLYFTQLRIASINDEFVQTAENSTHRINQKALTALRSVVETATSEQGVERIISVLKFIELIAQQSTIFVKLYMKPNLDECLCSVATLFLTDELFLNPLVSSAIKSCVLKLLHTCIPDESTNISGPFQDASKRLFSINISTYDFFLKLADQYEMASYSDKNFANFLSLFLTNDADSALRRYLFSERSITLASLKITNEDLWLPEYLFYMKRDTDSKLLEIYRRARNVTQPDSFMRSYIDFQLGLTKPQ